MRFGLICGGGGAVGIAWELGVLAGVKRAGIDPSRAAVVVGTSAGSAVGAHVALGQDLDELVERQRTPAPPAASQQQQQPQRDFGAAFADILPLIQSEGGMTEAVSARIGAIALKTEGLPSEEAWVRSFHRMLGTDEWPDTDLRVTAVDCLTGKRVAWTKDDDVPLTRAVASSCAIPAYFPTVMIHGTPYMDGGISGASTAELVRGLGLDAVLFVGPVPRMQQAGRNPFDRLAADRATLEADGIAWHEITPGDRFGTEIGMNLMDQSKRGLGAELGLEDGTAAAPAIEALAG